jgi:hypothetical protein
MRRSGRAPCASEDGEPGQFHMAGTSLDKWWRGKELEGSLTAEKRGTAIVFAAPLSIFVILRSYQRLCQTGKAEKMTE